MLSYNLITRQTFYSLGLSVSFSFIAVACIYDHKSDILNFLFQNDDVPLSEQTVAQVKSYVTPENKDIIWQNKLPLVFSLPV